tara:strand:+ start:8069 stop:8230 length:162 start_codon:yes stop_codon:yes gene_type:complete
VYGVQPYSLNGKEYQMFWLSLVVGTIAVVALYAVVIGNFEIDEDSIDGRDENV